ncbi:uncharacterized protein LOC101853927 [Aplysia californica]|uniref:Uncharacterized protein LOC101853927 n=1 Tax=Aplysia californica TaxID=6500 RepID=A0ABM0JLH6_APLCA|nr:uncharacterized protein LOC101853927 [Aplysia californica]
MRYLTSLSSPLPLRLRQHLRCSLWLMLLAVTVVAVHRCYHLSKIFYTDEISHRDNLENTFPYLQLERECISRQLALRHAYHTVHLLAYLRETCPNRRVLYDHRCSRGVFQNETDYRAGVKALLRDAGTLRELGLIDETEASLLTLPENEELRNSDLNYGAKIRIKGEHNFAIENAGTLKRIQQLESKKSHDAKTPNKPDGSTSPQNVTVLFTEAFFCHNTSVTWLEEIHTVDPSLCDRLRTLAQQIESGQRSPLLTLFTWWPDPLYDVEKLTRRGFWVSLDRLRPFVQPVLFSDSRMNVATANTLGWPCFPVPKRNQDGVPVFREMASRVRSRFQSTFYGYIQASTVFDSSLFHTLLSLLHLTTSRDASSTPGAHPESVSAFIRRTFAETNRNYNVRTDTFSDTGIQPMPVLLTGRSFVTSCSVLSDSLSSFHRALRKSSKLGQLNMADEGTLYYVMYSRGVRLDDVPDLTIDDQTLIPFLEARSQRLPHLVVTVTNTVLSVHHVRKSTTSEWNREYITSTPRDPSYNKRLVDHFWSSAANKSLNNPLVVTEYDTHGKIQFDLISPS